MYKLDTYYCVIRVGASIFNRTRKSVSADDTKIWARIQKLEDKFATVRSRQASRVVETMVTCLQPIKMQNNAYWTRPTNKIYHEH